MRYFRKNAIPYLFIFLAAIIVFDFGLYLGGDNFTYLNLAQSIAKFGTYSNIHLPGSPPHVVFPPLYPLILSLFYLCFGENALLAKILNVCLLVAALYFFGNLLNSERKKEFPTQIVTPWLVMVLGINSVLLSYSHWILTEIPYLFISLFSIYLFCLFLRAKRRVHFFAALCLSILGFYMRPIGISLVAAYMFYFLFSKHYREFAISFSFGLVFVIPWFLRSIILSRHYEVHSQVSLFFMKNPYDPGLGYASIGDFLTRFLLNAKSYGTWVMGSVFFDLPSKLFNLGLGMFCLFFIIIGAWKGKYLKQRFLGFYFLFYVIILALWPESWADKRYLIPIFPFLFVYFYHGIIFSVNHFTKTKNNLRFAVVPLLIIGFFYLIQIAISAPSKWSRNIEYLKGNILAPYPSGPARYFQTALWAKDYIPKGSVFVTRKPNMFYFFSKHKSISYPLTNELLELRKILEQNEVRYIIFNSSFVWDPVYLAPFIVANQDRMKVVYKTQDPEVHLIEYLQDTDSSPKNLSLGSARILEDAVKIAKSNFGPDHPNVAIAMNSLAEQYRTQERYPEAESLCEQALPIMEKAFGREHHYVAVVLSNLALLYKAQTEYTQAESLFNQALAIWEKTYGYEYLYVGMTCSHLADIYASQGKYSEAIRFYARALSIYEKELGKNNIRLVDILEKYAAVLTKDNKLKEAQNLTQRAMRIRLSDKNSQPYEKMD